mmetsp:Transcript_3653/g.10788  ORF Transcript_3653/g.10788 Transcript_3653/m.10788 type:complete len:215 (-) Transcript_3653:801-1445(-)
MPRGGALSPSPRPRCPRRRISALTQRDAPRCDPGLRPGRGCAAARPGPRRSPRSHRLSQVLRVEAALLPGLVQPLRLEGDGVGHCRGPVAGRCSQRSADGSLEGTSRPRASPSCSPGDRRPTRACSANPSPPQSSDPPAQEERPLSSPQPPHCAPGQLERVRARDQGSSPRRDVRQVHLAPARVGPREAQSAPAGLRREVCASEHFRRTPGPQQ